MKIFALWAQGEPQAPDQIRRIFDRWRDLNPQHELVIYDGPMMDAELVNSRIDTSQLAVQAKSDILRVKLLAEQGGCWVDASLLPVVALDSWLPSLMNPAGFFSFRQCGYDRLIGSWFLASEINNPIVVAWFESITQYMSKPRKLVNHKNLFWRLRNQGDYLNRVREEKGGRTNYYPYFWMHYLFEIAVTQNPELAKLWEKVPVWPVLPTHALQHARFHNKMTTSDFDAALPRMLRVAPVQKLDWRKAWSDSVFQDIDPETVIL